MRALVSILAITALACAGSNRPGTASLPAHGAIVEVRNDEFDDLVVYLIRGGTPIPLGVVAGNSRRAFGLQNAQLGSGDGVVLGVAKRGDSISRRTSVFELPPGRIATWVVRRGNQQEQPVVRD